MPLTFLLLSLPITIGIFTLIFALAILHELFVPELREAGRDIVRLRQNPRRKSFVQPTPRKKATTGVPWQAISPRRRGGRLTRGVVNEVHAYSCNRGRFSPRH
jgi:hypothetical protein